MTSLVVNEVQVLDLENPKPKLDAVLKIQGYKDPSKVRRTVRMAAETAIDGFIQSVEPSVSYRIVDIEELTDTTMTVHDDIKFHSPIFLQYMNNSRKIVVFALTVGEKIDSLTIDWMENEKLVEALFLESAAWLGVEDATKQFVLIVRAWAVSNGFRISRRLGPGYSYPINGKQIQWDLQDQCALFDCFDNVKIPVSILESSAMLPKMSRSGMFGLIPK